ASFPRKRDPRGHERALAMAPACAAVNTARGGLHRGSAMRPRYCALSARFDCHVLPAKARTAAPRLVRRAWLTCWPDRSFYDIDFFRRYLTPSPLVPRAWLRWWTVA